MNFLVFSFYIPVLFAHNVPAKWYSKSNWRAFPCVDKQAWLGHRMRFTWLLWPSICPYLFNAQNLNIRNFIRQFGVISKLRRLTRVSPDWNIKSKQFRIIAEKLFHSVVYFPTTSYQSPFGWAAAVVASSTLLLWLVHDDYRNNFRVTTGTASG